jgi:hypothetical protein
MPTDTRERIEPPGGRWSAIATFAALVAVLAILAACWAHFHRGALAGIFGPPPVTLHESYGGEAGGPTFDHALFDQILHRHVQPGGWVDYEGLRDDAPTLDRYIESLASAPLDAMGRDERLALLLNAYNAFTLRLILDHWPVASIRDIPSAQRWDAVRWNLGGHVWSLNQIEHEQIRPNFAEPRVHFALVCAAIGCPPLRPEAYESSRLDEQLQDQADYVNTHDRWVRFEPGEDTIHLTQLYDWYGGDFAQVAGSVLDFVARYVPALKTALDSGAAPSIQWIPYDWQLNSVANRPSS